MLTPLGVLALSAFSEYPLDINSTQQGTTRPTAQLFPWKSTKYFDL